MKYDYIVGIDPDTVKSGVVVVLNGNLNAVYSLTFPDLCNKLFGVSTLTKETYKVCIYVEAGWLNSKSNYHGQSGLKAQRVSKNVGANHQTGKLIVEMARSYGLNVEEVKPLKKCWNGHDRKITQYEIEKIIPGFPKKSNQEERDAALIAWSRL